MNTEIKAFLGGYRLQQAKINRLYEMMEQNPANANAYLSEIEKCKHRRAQIEKTIDSIGQELHKEVLCQKYICGKSLEEIAFSLNYSKRHIERIHLAALNLLKL